MRLLRLLLVLTKFLLSVCEKTGKNKIIFFEQSLFEGEVTENPCKRGTTGVVLYWSTSRRIGKWMGWVRLSGRRPTPRDGDVSRYTTHVLSNSLPFFEYRYHR